jgi:hemolysin D
MQKSIRPNSGSTPSVPPTPKAESPSRSIRQGDINPAPTAQANPTLTRSSFSSVYGGATASLDYNVKPLPIAPASQEQVTASATSANPQQTPGTNWSSSLQTMLDEPTSALPLRFLVASMGFCAAFSSWAWLGQIEEVGRAQGQLMPQGQPYKVNPVVSGKVARLAVKEGDTVKAGQVMVELDNQIAVNQVERLEKERTSYQTQLVQTQSLIDKTRLEAQTNAAMADAKEKSHDAILIQAKARVEGVQQTIAQAQDKVRTIRQILLQMRAEADAFKARQERLQPLATRSQQLLAQMRADVDASKQRHEELKPLPSMTQELILKLEADADAAKARIERLRPLVEQGALPRERLADLEQTWRDRQRAVTEAKLAQENRTKEQMFQAEQALRDRQRAIIQTQLQEDSSIKEQLFQADQALRDRARGITQTEGELKQATAELDRLQAELKQAMAELSRLQAQRSQNQAEAQAVELQNQQKIQQLEVQKTQMQAQIDQAEKQIAKAKTELKQLAFTAPVDGTVLFMSVRNSGEVVQAGQIVAEVAPQNAPLVLNAKLPNREAGFVKTGMEVKVKLDSFPYQDYGIVSGKVISISPDSQPDPQLGSIYRVEIGLDRQAVNDGRQTILFKPGQTATADIVTRRRRIADVLLDPLKQMQKSGLDL